MRTARRRSRAARRLGLFARRARRRCASIAAAACSGRSRANERVGSRWSSDTFANISPTRRTGSMVVSSRGGQPRRQRIPRRPRPRPRPTREAPQPPPRPRAEAEAEEASDGAAAPPAPRRRRRRRRLLRRCLRGFATRLRSTVTLSALGTRGAARVGRRRLARARRARGRAGGRRAIVRPPGHRAGGAAGSAKESR